MSAALEEAEPVLSLGAKFLDRFETRFELVRLEPPLLREVRFSPGAFVELMPPSMEALTGMVRSGSMILLRPQDHCQHHVPMSQYCNFCAETRNGKSL